MMNQTSEEQFTSVPASAEKTSIHSSKSRKLNTRVFDFLWKRDTQREKELKKETQKKEDLVEVKIIESKGKNGLSSKMSFEFFKNIKKHMQIKKLTIRRPKQKTKEIEVCSQHNSLCDALAAKKNSCSTLCTEDISGSNLQCKDTTKNSNILSSYQTLNTIDVLQNGYIAEAMNETIENYSNSDTKMETLFAQDIENNTMYNHENIPDIQSRSINEIQQLQHIPITENNVVTYQVDNIEEDSEANSINDYRVKASLTEELLKLSNYGWYWGPISGNEADAKLICEPDGAFLVRDSSDARYVLTLSFKSSGMLLHARMEHSGGLFSLCNQSESEGFSSVAELIDYSMNFSQSAVFCYSRPKYPGQPSFPVRLTKPVSRFTQVRSLQYLCRFVIRQNTRLDNIHKLPLPKTIKGYIEEAHY